MVKKGTNSKEKRSRGGQRGNLNALKHGYYSRQFHEGEIADLEEQFTEGLQDEIAMMKVITRRVLELAEGTDSLGEGLSLLGGMGLATTRLASLMKAQKLVFGGMDSFESVLSKTIDELMAEFEQENKDE